MAVAHTLLESSITTSNSTSYTTASVSYTAGRTYLLCVISSDNSTAEEPSISGTGTWTKLAENTSGAAAKIFLYYWVCGSSTSGTTTFTLTQSHTGFGWLINELTGDDGTPSGPWDTGTSSVGSDTSLAVSLDGGAPASTSRVFGFFMVNADEVQGHDADTEDFDSSVSTPNRALQQVYEDGGDGTITNSSTSSTARRGILVAVPAGSSSQTISSPALLSAAGTLFSPQVNQSVVLGLIDNSGGVFSPQINQSVVLGLIDQSGVTFQPTVTPGAVTLTPGLIDQSGQVFAPQVDLLQSLGLIDQSGQVFAPQVNQSVVLALIDQSGQVFAPTVSTSGGPQSITDPALLQAVGQLFAPQVNQAANIGLIDNSGQVFAPASIDQYVAVGLIDQSAVVYDLQANQYVVVDLIDNTAQVFAPQVDLVVSPGLIDQSGVVFNPDVSGGIITEPEGSGYWWF